jgi:protein gp37
MAQSKIEWTDATWNPVTGCTKISAGCKFCYAERMALRLQKMGQGRYRNGFKVTLHDDVLAKPLQWRKPQIIFVNSMSDLFHKDIPTDFIQRVFQVMEQAHWHCFQVLTKRPERVAEIAHLLPWPHNVWIGTSVEDERVIERIDHLRPVPAVARFLSLEPLIGPLDNLNFTMVDWVIVGGESGPGARPMPAEWVRNIRDQCITQGVPFFFKQWGGVQKSRTGRILDGRTWDEMPPIAATALGV